ncbi:hypothetical protein [Bradyrhizobium sp. CB3481]|uniref:hypothetical protein n=1 Tax=Bradyrhizobium sp. CB3481 TaxID=3039158 RepID=UPI0024B072A3|nr:hypothetical protein [Bradyrhizobium sp. CB3481]WFU18679.1 hypothetical protein QA643_10220 [Bradyrhizobium sp. CB3481]
MRKTAEEARSFRREDRGLNFVAAQLSGQGGFGSFGIRNRCCAVPTVVQLLLGPRNGKPIKMMQARGQSWSEGP